MGLGSSMGHVCKPVWLAHDRPRALVGRGRAAGPKFAGKGQSICSPRKKAWCPCNRRHMGFISRHHLVWIFFSRLPEWIAKTYITDPNLQMINALTIYTLFLNLGEQHTATSSISRFECSFWKATVGASFSQTHRQSERTKSSNYKITLKNTNTDAWW